MFLSDVLMEQMTASAAPSSPAANTLTMGHVNAWVTRHSLLYTSSRPTAPVTLVTVSCCPEEELIKVLETGDLLGETAHHHKAVAQDVQLMKRKPAA